MTDEQAQRLTAILGSKSWVIQDDNTTEFRDMFRSYFNRLPNRLLDVSAKVQTHSINYYYGVNSLGRVDKWTQKPQGYTEWTKEAFTGYYNAVLNNNSTTNTTNTEDNGKPKTGSEVSTTEVRSKTARIATGQRPAGTSICGRRCKAAIKVGHLSNRACSI